MLPVIAHALEEITELPQAFKRLRASKRWETFPAAALFRALLEVSEGTSVLKPVLAAKSFSTTITTLPTTLFCKPTADRKPTAAGAVKVMPNLSQDSV